MLCCIVLLAFFGFVLRRGSGEDPLPPQARRTMAGDPLVGAGTSPKATGRAQPTAAARARSRRRIAIALITAGIAWTISGMLDMYLTGMIAPGLGHLMHFPGFNAVGLAAVLAGSILLIINESGGATAVTTR